ncbi:MAG: YtxH domain-containing protein [Pseudomonadota bacterium]
MAFPVSFAVGAALGATAAYLYKDQPARERLIEKSKQMKDQAVDKINSLRKKSEPESITQEQSAAASA